MALLFTLPRVSTIDLVGEVAPGAQLYFFATGTSTPRTVYSDSALTIFHPHPVPASDAGLFPVIYLDDTLGNVKVVCRDANGVELWSVDPYLTGPTQAQIGAALYPRTDGEIDAGITPSNYAYPTGNVLRYGADPTGAIDSTSAFNQANVLSGSGRATKRVFAPAGIYKVTNIEVVNGMWVEGECHGSGANAGDATVLEVGTNGAGAFRHSTSTDKFWITIRNLHIRAAAGVTNARGYLQSDKSVYIVNVTFENVSTERNLLIGYDGFFLIARWLNCWDGYAGAAPGGQQHQFITSLPATFGQIRQTNLCSVRGCSVFGATSGVAAAIDVAWGGKWDIVDGTQIEDMDAPGIRMRGVFGGSIDCWFENVRAANLAIFDASPTVVQGCGNWSIRDTQCTVYGFTGTELFSFAVGAAMNVTLDSIELFQIDTGVSLVSGVTSVVSATNVRALSGDGASNAINIPVDGSGSFTVGLSGTTTTVEGTCYYVQSGSQVTLFVPTLTGTSNATTCTITGIPTSLRPARQQGNLLCSIQDNGTRAVGIARPETDGTMTCFPSLTALATDWTNSGTKTVSAFNVAYQLS